MKRNKKLFTIDKAALGILAGSLLAVAPVWAQDTNPQSNTSQSSMASEDARVRTSQPEVIVEQADPEVSVVQPTPEVRVQQADPEIVVNDAQPEVKVNQADPEVEIIESEPEINIVEKDKAAQSGQQATGEEQQQTAQTDEQLQTDKQLQTDEQLQTDKQLQTDEQLQTDKQLQGKNGLMQMEVTKVQGMSVENQKGEELGSVRDIVVDRQTGNAGLVITVGGFWGFGGTDVFVPVDEVAVSNDLIVWQTSASQEVIEEQAQYDQQNYVSVID